MDCLTVGTQTLYGPLSIEDESLVPRLTHGQLKDIYEPVSYTHLTLPTKRIV